MFEQFDDQCLMEFATSLKFSSGKDWKKLVVSFSKLTIN